MKEESSIVSGREVKHKDVILHTTTTEFKFWDRLKILFGKKVIIDSRIYTTHDICNVVASESRTFVERLFPYKSKGEGLVMPKNNL